jgi:hypothetical protein
MEYYEIHILYDDGKTALVTSASHLNDNAAIRSARKIARTRKFEVWRGMNCVYGTAGAPVINLPTRNRPEA